MKWQRLQILAVIFTLSCCAGDPPHDQTRPTSICSIAQSSSQYEGRMVSVRARLLSDGRDMSVLLDPACPSVALSFSVGKRADATVDDFANRLMEQGRFPSTVDREVFAEFTGVFKIVSSPVPRRILEVVSIRHEQIPPRKTVGHSSGEGP
jgi:hypothetical protein